MFYVTVILAVLAVIVAAVALLWPKHHASTITDVTITNSSLFSDQLDPTTITSVQTGTADMMKHNHTTGTYTGVIRGGSLTIDYVAYQGQEIPETTFMVDIPAAKQSYEVDISGGPTFSFNILHVSCPPSDKVIYSGFHCKDEVQ